MKHGWSCQRCAFCVNKWQSEYTVTGQVRVAEGAWEKSGSGLGADWKSFGVDGKQKDLASTRALCPCAHRGPISESQSDRKGNRGHRS